MKIVELQFSKSKIDKAGETLKKKQIKKKEVEESLEVLSNWRAYHVITLDTFAKVLRTRAKKISLNFNTIVAQRLKRTPSILLKLRTHKTMRLSTMQDVGGLRVIFETVEEVDKLVNLYRTSKSRHTLFSIDDYTSKPKTDGYRGVHLVYKIKKTPSVFIEIQVRSYLQHIWATGVEVFGTLKNSSFKSGYGDKNWLDFFSTLSSVFALKERTQVLDDHCLFTKQQLLTRVKKMIRDLRVIEQLSVYTSIYRMTSSENKKNNRGRKGSYSLILLNSHENTISVKTFGISQIEDATDAYMQTEKDYYNNTNMNVVLVNTGDLKKLEVSYPNYFMDTKKLVMYLSQIVIDEFIEPN